jgi:predicted O-linked N-acetylglucosamine transferase (SPINDLY family)
VHAISIGSNAAPTPMRTRLEAAFEHFHDMPDKTPAEIAGAMRAQEIDIAVDLMGFTGECRPGIFAARPAPVQVNYLGFPGTMGADYIDYLIADRTLIPGHSAAFYSEAIVTLPDTYQANDSRRTRGSREFARAELGLPEDRFVFCAFHNAFKINPETFALWMRLLAAVPESVLWLLEDNAFMRANLAAAARADGIGAERLVFAPRVAVGDHLARLRAADLFLDAFPCGAHTTASDALWMGLPVLTRTGESFASRVAASLLTALGLPELITASAEDYETLALKLARDRKLLAALRGKVARQGTISPLFDTARFTRNLEAAYTTMWQRYQKGEPPAAFAVAGAP